MYKRDATVEMNATFERMAQALDQLNEIVAREETSKEISDFLKGLGARSVREAPKSDNRVEELIRAPRLRQTGALGQTDTLQQASFTKFHNVVKAMTGDLSAFQRVVFSTITSAKRAETLVQTARSLSTSSPSSVVPQKTYRPATDAEITAAMRLAASQGKPGEAILAAAAKLANEGIAVNSPAQRRAIDITERAKDTGLAARGATGVMRASGATAGIDVAALVRIGTTVALAAAPLVAGKLIHSATLGQIEDKRPLANLDPNLALSYGLYGQNQVLTQMKHARGISKTMDALLKSEAEFEKTLEPISTLWTNAKNKVLTIGTTVMNTFLKPISLLSDAVNEGDLSKMPGQVNQAFKAFTDVFPFLPGLRPIGTIIDGIHKGLGLKKPEDNDRPEKTGIEAMAWEITRVPICPPQRFVP